MAGLWIILFSSTQAQDYRLSLGYSLEKVGLNYSANDQFSGSINPTTNGLIKAELERYLLYRLYIAGRAEYLFHDQTTPLFGGPLQYDQLNSGALLGLQWPKFGLYAGVEGGHTWNVSFKGEDGTGETVYLPAVQGDGRWSYGFTGGVKYYLLNFLRVEAELTKTFNLEESLSPEPVSGQTAAITSANFNPFSIRLGVSISIPWNKQSRLEKINDTGKLPPLMEVGGVNFATPMQQKALVTSPFGPRWRDTHEGVDIDAERGQNIYAAESGVVLKAGKGTGYGKMVKIQHSNGYVTIYAHLSRIKTKAGQKVKRGEVIGKAGNTGTSSGVHLHFEILKDGKPMDPQKFIRF
ncbi:MAG: M23 family metallopeptidase [Bacteroidota bacterium]